MQRSLTQREIEECLYEDLPSGPESEASSDEDENLDTPEWPVSKSILDVCGADVQNIHEELFDDEDDIPLSNFVSQNNIVSSTTTLRNFCESLEGKNHKVFFDNYFNGYPLQVHLKEKKVLACGTVNSNIKFLPVLKDDKQLRRGQHDYKISDSNISLLKWKDKRSVFILSNYLNPQDVEQVTRRERDGSAVRIDCPLAVKKYNSNMNFVDKFDQLKACYSIDRKSQKWWHRIFFHFLDCCVINSYIAYKELLINRPHLDELTLKDFRRSIYQGLLAPCYVNKRAPGSSAISNGSSPRSPVPVAIKRYKPSVPAEIRHESNRHQPLRGTPRRCAFCSTKSVPVRTVWQCRTCHVPLCLRKGKTCFSDFHKK